jgi:hypothetical protein
MRSDWRDFSATFLTAGMLKLPAATSNTMRISQTGRFEEAAVVIEVPPSGQSSCRKNMISMPTI